MFAAACARSVRAARGVPLARFAQRAAYSASSTIPAPIADADIPLNPPAFSLAGRRVLITGGARGLGLAMGQAILASGADVALVDMNVDEATAQARRLTTAAAAAFDRDPHARAPAAERAPVVTAHYADVADPASVDACLQEVIEAQAAAAGEPADRILVNGLVTAAGFTENVPATQYPPDRLQALWSVNVNGTYYMATAVARHLAARGNAPGSMVLVGSMSGAVVNVPQPQAPYNASKAAIRNLAMSLAVEWAPAGVRVNCLSPGYMETPLTGALMDAQPALRQQWTGGVPMGRLGAPTDLAGPVVFMLSDAASYMTGADLRVDGGYTII